MILDPLLLSSLIGLVRAMDGNEDIITTETAALLIQGLKTNDCQLIAAIEKEKQRLVPDCYTCEVNCGRTANFNINELHYLSEDVYQIKMQILKELIDIVHTNDAENKIINQIIQKGLFAFGDSDYDSHSLANLLFEIQELNIEEKETVRILI